MEDIKVILEDTETDAVSGGLAADTLEYRKGGGESVQTLELRKVPESCPRCGSKKLEREVIANGVLVTCKLCGEKFIARQAAAEVVLL